jgi:hypothetical protein
LGLQKSNQKEKEVDPFAQLGSPGKKIKSGQRLEIPIQFWRRKD